MMQMPTQYSPQRVVCLQPSATVILDAIGCLDHVVACTKYCVDVCPGVRDSEKVIVADSWTAQSDQILSANPDLVIAAIPYQEKAVSEILKSGARFLGLAPRVLADIYGDIVAIAGIMGLPEEGERVADEMQREIEAVRAQTGSLSRRRVFCEEWGKPIIASQKWVAELIEAAGGTLTAAPGMQQDAATVLQMDPEVFIASWCGAGDRVPLEKIVENRNWGEMSAVKTGRVFCINDEYLNTPAPTLVAGLKALTSAIHPEIFPQAAGLRCIERTMLRKY
jgi:iron complex transport system substrate-binding protein